MWLLFTRTTEAQTEVSTVSEVRILVSIEPPEGEGNRRAELDDIMSDLLVHHADPLIVTVALAHHAEAAASAARALVAQAPH